MAHARKTTGRDMTVLRRCQTSQDLAIQMKRSYTYRYHHEPSTASVDGGALYVCLVPKKATADSDIMLEAQKRMAMIPLKSSDIIQPGKSEWCRRRAQDHSGLPPKDQTSVVRRKAVTGLP